MIRRALRGRLLCTVAGGALLLGVAAVALDRIFPPDMSRLSGTSAQILDSEGRVLRAFTTASGAWRLRAGPADVGSLYLDMLLAYEDQRFRSHPGVDPLAVARAVGQMVSHRRIVSGASTITMQTARLLEPRPRTLGAKLSQMLRALQLEARYSKDEILSHYLTLAPYGGNLEGVRAASLAWFGKVPAQLAPSEAALLVALPQSPETLRPDRHPQRARAARDKVLDVMARRGVLSAAAVAEAKRDPVPGTRHAMPFTAPHLARLLAAQAGGDRRTTIDGDLQRQLEHLVRMEQAALDPGATIAMLVVENEGRRIRAWVGSSDFFDDSRQGQIDMVRAIRSPGSTLKPFIYGVGFDDLLIHPRTVTADMPIRFGNYQPENFLNVYRGEVTIAEALRQSLNVPAVAVLDRIGPRRFDARLRNAGIELLYGGTGGEPGLPLALGGVGMSLHDLVTLYAGLADGGHVRPLKIVEGDGQDAGGDALLGERAAWYVTRILEGAPPPANFVDPAATSTLRRMAYKTGTSYGYRDAWAVGYDANHTVGVWVGRPDGTPSPDRYGRATAAPLLFRVFGLLPGDGGPANPERPDSVMDLATTELPPRLQRLGGATEAPKSVARRIVQPPIVSYPPDGAEVDLEGVEGGYAPLPLLVDGGRKPFRWLVNGKPVDARPDRRQAGWTPDGKGFVQITVFDAEGRIARAEVLLR